MGQRDELGRFLPGNSIAKGNKGNRFPKYGNRNAEKHVFYSNVLTILPRNTLMPIGDKVVLMVNGKPIGELPHKYWTNTAKGIAVRTDIAEILIDGYGLSPDSFDFDNSQESKN